MWGAMIKAIIRLLKERVTGRPQKPGRTLYHHLDGFVGRWSKKEAAGFDKALAEQREIDPDLWK